MVKFYAFLWHVNHKDMTKSEGVVGYYCEAAEAERPSEDEAKKALEAWLTKRQEACKDSDCEHKPIITNEIRPKMIMAGMTINMAKI
jgi:hypothetical protein